MGINYLGHMFQGSFDYMMHRVTKHRCAYIKLLYFVPRSLISAQDIFKLEPGSVVYQPLDEDHIRIMDRDNAVSLPPIRPLEAICSSTSPLRVFIVGGKGWWDACLSRSLNVASHSVANFDSIQVTQKRSRWVFSVGVVRS
jgi:hypothetical protein